ncbi:MAG: proline--tRNA ligase [Theionarchaea archaeon]|nr:proline--tRNA ligase [Theionarchaea archaeon]MBU7001442.1 proline--tRNA ligase [Theionarchaea archaeon]
MSEDLGITIKKEENFSEWYNQVVLKAELADYSPVKGCMVIRPHGYRIWELIQSFLDTRIKETGHQNVYFPLFIPEHFFEREAEHVKGFSPEVAWVTHGGDTPLEEKLAVRPTSETIMYDMYSKWVRSWRDLPLLLNQWCNIVRWETKMTKLFMRTREFLWQEGHTAHSTKEEADEEALKMLDVYREVYEDLLAIPVIQGTKTESEKFPGALYTLTLESLMPDNRATQSATTHNLGQHFSKAFDITFIDKDEQKKYVWQTSWGLSTRSVAVAVMVHSDDKGLVLPPRVAPIHVVIIPIIFQESREAIQEMALKVKEKLGTVVVVLDDREEYTAGWKFNHWEVKGVPVRIEIGPRDVKKDQVVLVRRDTGEKRAIPVNTVEEEVQNTLVTIQEDLFRKAKRFLEENTVTANNYEDLKACIEDKKLVRTNWCGSEECEAIIKDETGASSCCIPFNEEVQGTCVYCGKDAKYPVYFAKHY